MVSVCTYSNFSPWYSSTRPKPKTRIKIFSYLVAELIQSNLSFWRMILVNSTFAPNSNCADSSFFFPFRIYGRATHFLFTTTGELLPGYSLPCKLWLPTFPSICTTIASDGPKYGASTAIFCSRKLVRIENMLVPGDAIAMHMVVMVLHLDLLMFDCGFRFWFFLKWLLFRKEIKYCRVQSLLLLQSLEW